MKDTIESLQNELARRIDESSGMAHVIIMHGVVPGASDSCRCDECRTVATGMADAGYLDDIKDRWWERQDE